MTPPPASVPCGMPPQPRLALRFASPTQRPHHVSPVVSTRPAAYHRHAAGLSWRLRLRRPRSATTDVAAAVAVDPAARAGKPRRRHGLWSSHPRRHRPGPVRRSAPEVERGDPALRDRAPGSDRWRIRCADPARPFPGALSGRRRAGDRTSPARAPSDIRPRIDAAQSRVSARCWSAASPPGLRQYRPCARPMIRLSLHRPLRCCGPTSRVSRDGARNHQGPGRHFRLGLRLRTRSGFWQPPLGASRSRLSPRCRPDSHSGFASPSSPPTAGGLELAAALWQQPLSLICD